MVCIAGMVGGVYRPEAEIVPTVLFPPTTPSTAHVKVAVPPLSVAVNCCSCDGVNEACPGSIFTKAFANVPVPFKFTVCKNEAAVSFTVMYPVRVPVKDGVKVTLTVQFVPGLSEPGQLFVCE